MCTFRHASRPPLAMAVARWGATGARRTVGTYVVVFASRPYSAAPSPSKRRDQRGTRPTNELCRALLDISHNLRPLVACRLRRPPPRCPVVTRSDELPIDVDAHNRHAVDSRHRHAGRTAAASSAFELAETLGSPVSASAGFAGAVASSRRRCIRRCANAAACHGRRCGHPHCARVCERRSIRRRSVMTDPTSTTTSARRAVRLDDPATDRRRRPSRPLGLDA